MRLALADVAAKTEREGRGGEIFGERGQYSEDATFCVLQKRAAFSALEVSFQLAGSAAKSFYHAVNADVDYRAARDRRETTALALAYSVSESRELKRVGNDIGHGSESCAVVLEIHTALIAFFALGIDGRERCGVL